MASPRGAKMCLKLRVLECFIEFGWFLQPSSPQDPRPDRFQAMAFSKVASDVSWIDFLTYFGSIEERKTDENLVFCECFTIFSRTWLQHGAFVVQWLGKHFRTIFCGFLSSWRQKENFKPWVLPIFCDFRSYLKILETSCCKKAPWKGKKCKKPCVV